MRGSVEVPIEKTTMSTTGVTMEADEEAERDRDRDKLTLIPEGLAQDLVAAGGGLGDLAGLLGLLDFSKGGGGIAAVLVEGGGLHLVFDGRDVDGGHWVEVCHPATGDGHALRYRCVRGAAGD